MIVGDNRGPRLEIRGQIRRRRRLEILSLRVFQRRNHDRTLRNRRRYLDSLGQSGLAEAGIIRPETGAGDRGDCSDATVAEHFGHPQVIDDAVIVVFTALGRANT